MPGFPVFGFLALFGFGVSQIRLGTHGIGLRLDDENAPPVPWARERSILPLRPSVMDGSTATAIVAL